MTRRNHFIAWALSVAALCTSNSKLEAADAAKNPGEAKLKTVSLFDGKTLDGWIQVPDDSWVVKDGAMASTGNGHGVVYTKDDYSKFRLLFSVRHLKSKQDHHAGGLIFCTRPDKGAKPLDALAGIQFQVPRSCYR
jgi:hypothetical protein